MEIPLPFIVMESLKGHVAGMSSCGYMGNEMNGLTGLSCKSQSYNAASGSKVHLVIPADHSLTQPIMNTCIQVPS